MNRRQKVYINSLMHNQITNFQCKKLRIDLVKLATNPERHRR